VFHPNNIALKVPPPQMPRRAQVHLTMRAQYVFARVKAARQQQFATSRLGSTVPIGVLAKRDRFRSAHSGSRSMTVGHNVFD
jgi:hypothetical protein